MNDQDEMMQYLKVQREADQIRMKYGGSSARVDMMQMLHDEMLKKNNDMDATQNESKDSDSKKVSIVNRPPKSKPVTTAKPAYKHVSTVEQVHIFKLRTQISHLRLNQQ